MAEARRRWTRRVRRRVTSGLLIVVAGAVPLLWNAAPAAATTATGSMTLDGLLAKAPVGTPVSFTGSYINNGPDRVSKLRVVVRVSATGVELQMVRLEHRELDGTWALVTSKTGNKGDVKFIDDSDRDMDMDPGAALSGRYRITFMPGTPSGLAVISADAQHKTDGTWVSLARSPQYVTEVTAPLVPGGGGSVGGNAGIVSGSPLPGASKPAASPTPVTSPAATVGGDAVPPSTRPSEMPRLLEGRRPRRPCVCQRGQFSHSF